MPSDDRFAYAAESTSPGQLGVADLLRLLRRKKLLIFVTVGLSLAATIFWLRSVTPVYSATATIAPYVNSRTQSEEFSIKTLVQLLQSKPLAIRVIERLELEKDPAFAPAASGNQQRAKNGQVDPPPRQRSVSKSEAASRRKAAELLTAKRRDAIADKLLKQIRVEQVGGSRLIAIRAVASDPMKAVELANAFADTYVQDELAERHAARKRTIARLTGRVEELRKHLLKADRAVAAYERQRNLPGVASDAAAADMNRIAGQIAAQLAEARASRAEVEVRFRGSGAGAGSAAEPGTSAVLTDLRRQETELRRRLAQLSINFGAGHPEVAAATAQLDDVQSRIAEEAARNKRELRDAVAGQRAREGQLASELGAMQARSMRQISDSVGLMDLAREAETTRLLYVSELARLKELTAQTTDVGSDAGIISRATVSSEPAFPRPKRILAVSTIGSCLLAFLLAYVSNSVDQRIRTAGQVRRLLGLRTLAMLPTVWRHDGRAPYKEVLDSPCSTFAEAVRSLYLELAAPPAAHPPQTIVVTSALPREGKTTIAMSLAAAAASVGRRAVAVDLDLRRPGLLRALNLPENPPGVLEYLAHEASVDDLLVWDEQQADLAWICTDPSPNPGAALSSPKLRALLDELRQGFEVIVLNAPPILPVRDAKTLAEMADATLFILPWGTSPDAPLAAVQSLTSNLVGVVINRVNYQKHARQAYGDAIQHYGKYSMYYRFDSHSDEVKKKPKRRTSEKSLQDAAE